MKKAIYTVITGEYDDLETAPKFAGWDCFLFTDQKIEDSKGWNVIEITETGDNKKISRKYKILAHQYLPDYDLYCYIDGSGRIFREPPKQAIHISHPRRKKVKDECSQIIALGKEDSDTVRNQLESYQKEGFRDDVGLYANGFFVRPNEPRYNKIYEDWYSEVEKHSYRDQISFPYVLWKHGVRVRTMKHGFLSKLVKYKAHKRRANDVSSFSIHHITPGRPDKNFGKAINDIVKGLPENDWICLRDIDTLVLDHATLFKQLDDIVKLHGKEYDMFGAMTNDLGLKWQLYEGKLSRTYNLEDHHKIAKKLSREKYSEVTHDKGNHIGGFFMLFSKAIWQKIGGLPEGLVIKGKFIDYIFSKMVEKAGGKIGICQGVYIYHFCRYGKPRKDTTHLYNSKK